MESEYLLENIGIRDTLKGFEGKTELSSFTTCSTWREPSYRSKHSDSRQ